MKDCLPTRLHSVSWEMEHLNTQVSSAVKSGVRVEGYVDVSETSFAEFYLTVQCKPKNDRAVEKRQYM